MKNLEITPTLGEGCPKCDAEGSLHRDPTDQEVLSGTYSGRVYYDCDLCYGSGAVERCELCDDLYALIDEGSALNPDRVCWRCEKTHVLRKAVVGESGIDGLTLHYYEEKAPNVWRRVGCQHEQGRLALSNDSKSISTSELSFCSDWAVIVSDTGFKLER